jgi:hypothetical protein
MRKALAVPNIGLALGFIAMTGASVASAAPPPPPPAFMDLIAKQLVPTQTVASFDRYAAFLANDLKVTVDGREIAANKSAWLAIERNRLGKVDRLVYGFAEGSDKLLVLDRFDDRSDEHCPTEGACVFDSRYHVRATQYQIGPDHLVHAIRILESDSFLRTPETR